MKADYDYRELLKDRSVEAEKDEEIRIKADIYRLMPIQQMIKLRWLSAWKTVDDLVREVKIFWRRDNLDFSFLNNQQIASYNRSSEAYADNFNYYNSRVWLQKAHLLSEDIELPNYNKAELTSIFERISHYTFEDNSIQNIIKDLKHSGVGFLVLDHLPRTYMDGACFFRDNNPFIVYTCRHDRVDNFWFLIAHEIAHILTHLNESNAEGIIDDLSTESRDLSAIEKEADSLAKTVLKHHEILQYFREIDNISKISVTQCSRELKIHPAIILGALQYNNIISWNHYLNKHKVKVSDSLRDIYRYTKI